MEFISYLIDLFVNLDSHLHQLIVDYGTFTYVILFVVIFSETGFVFTPFLPGDSLLFAAGTFAAKGSFNVNFLVILLSAGAILGDTVNYWIGNYIGPKAFHKNTKFFKKENLEKTHAFYEKYGGKAIIIARFIPIIRTFTPFVAGIGAMTYSKFLFYNVLGGLAWCLIFIYGGYFFGNIPVVRANFSIVILGIVFLSILPGIVKLIISRRKKSSPKAE